MAPTVPVWNLIIYYGFLLLTFGVSIYMLYKKELFKQSLINLFLIPIIIVLNILGSMSRVSRNELQYWFYSVLNLEIWALLGAAIIMYLFFWWFLLFKKTKSFNHQTSS